MTDGKQATFHRSVQEYRDGQTTFEQLVAGTGAAFPDLPAWWGMIRAHIPLEEWRAMERHPGGNIHRDEVLLTRQRITADYVSRHRRYGVA